MLNYCSFHNLIKINIVLLLILPLNHLFAQEKILRFDHLTVEQGLCQNTVMGIVKDKYGFMWFGTFEGLCRYDGYKFKKYRAASKDPHSLWNNRVSLIYKDIKSNIWILTADTLICMYNYETDDFLRFTPKNAPRSILDSLDRSKSIFFTRIIHGNTIWQVNQSFNKLTMMYPFNRIANLNMLTQTNVSTGQKIIYKTDIFNRWSLNDESIFNIYLDNNDILWVGTYSGGVNKADVKQNPFKSYSHNPLHPDKSIIDDKIRAIYQDKEGNLWIGTHNKGITNVNVTTGKYTHYQHSLKDTLNSLIENEVRKIYCDRFGYLWIGTKGGVEKFDPKTNHFKHYTLSSGCNLPNNWVYSIMEDHSGYLWIGTWNGIAKFDRKHDRFYPYNPAKTLKRGSVRVILEDHNYNLWVATEGGGITKLSRDSANGFRETLTPTHFNFSLSDTNSLSSDRVYCMLEDEKGIFWIGTNSGLTRFDPEKNKFTRFLIEQGLPDELIIGLLPDKKGHIWISHKKGLTRMNTQTFETKNYDGQDGLQDNEFSEDAYFRNDKTGEMFFGGVKGFNSFYPDSIKDNKYLPRVVITELLISDQPVRVNKPVNGRIILTKQIFLTQQVTLDYSHKNISIEFAALHYSNPSDNKYLHKLRGFDKDWVPSDAKNRIASYPNLEPGEYVFEVKASNNDGLWNPVPTELKIVILHPWWRTWLFRGAFFTFIILFIYGLIYLRVSLYRQKQKELTKLVKERTLKLQETNELLLDRQTRIEEQSEELRTHSDSLKEANHLLVQRQALIKSQADKLQEANDELLVLNSTKDRFFSIIAHDLRNPFHVVSGFSELLLREYHKLPPEKIEKYLNLMYNSSRSGNILLENLLQWSRSQTGSITFEPIHLNLLMLTEETYNFLEGDAHKKNINVQLKIDPEINIVADENMLKTILRNLLSNAIKFTREKGEIIIKAYLTPDFAEISVIDSGIGIPEENIPLLFKIETNVSTRGTSHESGTGLGLILCKEFVERHHGKIWVETKVGVGSQFKFMIPLK
jgi:signal transduction histidine kinase/ligand-binding sensor domain-containing protein